MNLSRRRFLIGAVAAPAIIPYANLMPVRGIVQDVGPILLRNTVYYVVADGMTSHSFTFSTAPGGVPVNITATPGF